MFKASYDKANRTSTRSFRGPGLVEGLRILGRVRDTIGVPILTDIHEASHAAPAADVADVLQIPAFLSRQTDVLVAAARTGRVVNIKKGQFLAPLDMRHAIEKVTSSGNPNVIVTERGFTFGYNNLVVDMRAFPMLRALGCPVVYDVTHSLQLPGAGDGVTSGQAEFIEPLASAGVAAGVDGVFMEVHDNPPQAKSDAQNALKLDRLPALLDRLVRIHDIVRQSTGTLSGAHDDTAGAGHDHGPGAGEESSPHRGVRHSRPRGAARRRRSIRRSQLLFECRGRVIVTGMGKSGIICRKIAATLSSTGTSALFLHPAEAIHGDLGAIREDDVVMALSHSGETEELVRLLEAIRRIGARLVALTASAGVDAGARGGRGPGLQHRQGSLPDEPRADGEHDRRARARRCPRAHALGPQGFPRRGVRVAAPRRQAREAADARRERDERRRRRPARATATRACPRSSTRCRASVSA